MHYTESPFRSCLLSLLAIFLIGNWELRDGENRMTYWTNFAPRHSWQENGCLTSGFEEWKTRCFLAMFNRCYSSLKQHFKMQIPRVYVFQSIQRMGKWKFLASLQVVPSLFSFFIFSPFIFPNELFQFSIPVADTYTRTCIGAYMP